MNLNIGCRGILWLSQGVYYIDSLCFIVTVRPDTSMCSVEMTGDHTDGNTASSIISDAKSESSGQSDVQDLQPRRSQSVVILDRHKPMIRQPCTCKVSYVINVNQYNFPVQKIFFELFCGNGIAHVNARGLRTYQTVSIPLMPEF
jgi:hypothetical protein